MDVVKNILGDVEDEVKMMKQDLEYLKSIGDKAGAMKVQERLEGLI